MSPHQLHRGRPASEAGLVPVWAPDAGVACFGAQGLSPDALMGRVMTAKTEVRKALLKRHMAALDEAEGLQDITTRLSERMGIGARALGMCCHVLPRAPLWRGPPRLTKHACARTSRSAHVSAPHAAPMHSHPSRSAHVPQELFAQGPFIALWGAGCSAEWWLDCMPGPKSPSCACTQALA
jgi:hypothetical protein